MNTFTSLIQLRVSPEFKALVGEYCQENSVNLSALLRKLLERHIKDQYK